MTDHPITPPDELVRQWATTNGTAYKDLFALCKSVATQAARWGADQELEGGTLGPMTEEHELIKGLVAELQPYSVAHPSHQLPALEAGHAWLLRQPPCSECGAMTPEEAQTLCICSGDKDHCHGSDLWPD